MSKEEARNLPRLKKPRPLGRPSLPLIRSGIDLCRDLGVVVKEFFGLSVLSPSELCDPEAELQQTDLQESRFSNAWLIFVLCQCLQTPEVTM